MSLALAEPDDGEEESGGRKGERGHPSKEGGESSIKKQERSPRRSGERCTQTPQGPTDYTDACKVGTLVVVQGCE